MLDTGKGQLFSTPNMYGSCFNTISSDALTPFEFWVKSQVGEFAALPQRLGQFESNCSPNMQEELDFPRLEVLTVFEELDLK